MFVQEADNTLFMSRVEVLDAKSGKFGVQFRPRALALKD